MARACCVAIHFPILLCSQSRAVIVCTDLPLMTRPSEHNKFPATASPGLRKTQHKLLPSTPRSKTCLHTVPCTAAHAYLHTITLPVLATYSLDTLLITPAGPFPVATSIEVSQELFISLKHTPANLSVRPVDTAHILASLHTRRSPHRLAISSVDTQLTTFTRPLQHLPLSRSLSID